MSSCGWFPLSYDEILAWIEQHRESLPTTLAELSAFPVAFRRVIVNYVSPDQRTRFWQEHLGTFLEPASELSPDQRAYIVETIPLLPDIFNSPLAEAQAKMRPLEARMGKSLRDRSAQQSSAWWVRRNRRRDSRYLPALE